MSITLTQEVEEASASLSLLSVGYELIERDNTYSTYRRNESIMIVDDSIDKVVSCFTRLDDPKYFERNGDV